MHRLRHRIACLASNQGRGGLVKGKMKDNIRYHTKEATVENNAPLAARPPVLTLIAMGELMNFKGKNNYTTNKLRMHLVLCS